eukprot:5323849-Alexandrium_andersonii.AAC.1
MCVCVSGHLQSNLRVPYLVASVAASDPDPASSMDLALRSGECRVWKSARPQNAERSRARTRRQG